MSRRPLAPQTRRRVALAMLAALGLLTAGLALPSCSGGSGRDPMLREPALLIEGPALARLLTRTRALVGTPAGQASAELFERLHACPEVAGHFVASADAGHADGASFADRLDCRDDARLDPDLVSRLDRERGDHAGLLQWPIGRTGRVALWVDVDEVGGVVLGGVLEPAEASDERGPEGLASLLIPAATPPGEPVIDAAASLVHVQLRPAAGLRLASLIPTGSQGDRLFALKGRLLEGTLLEGTLELAFLPPAPGGRVPLALVALHHRAAGPIEAALDEALDQLERTWTLTRTPRRFPTAVGERLGGCYVDLPILPELAPCWVVTEEALLIGYRAEALTSALAAPGGASDRASHLLVDLERVRALDEALPDAPDTGIAELYSRLELHGRSEGGGRVALAGELRARP